MGENGEKNMEDQMPSTEEPEKENSSVILSSDADIDEEAAELKPKYPKSVFFIVSNEFCERFSYYGMRTILAIFLKNELHYNDDDATVIFHVFAMLCYFFPVFGAMLADSLLGKFRTIFYISIIYAIGNVVMSVASATGAIEIPARELSIVALLLIAIGTGGIKPCVAAFGGDQFKLPQQERQLQQFFSVFYFSINAGSLISTFVTPILREDVKCFGQETCYPLAFGIPAALMIVSLVIFLLGRRSYIDKKPEGNVVIKVCKCVGHALSRRFKVKNEKREHWLEYADDKYSKTDISDIKAMLRVLYLYIPLPVFWALYEQQSSRWTFQATRMTGELGSWSLKPDQMQFVNPLLILAFIPLFEAILYPLLNKCHIGRPLQKMGMGGLLAALAFVVSALIEMQLKETYAVVPQGGEAQLRIFNGFNCEATFEFSNLPDNVNEVKIEPLAFWNSGTLDVKDSSTYHINSVKLNCTQFDSLADIDVIVKEKEAISYFLTYGNSTTNLTLQTMTPEGAKYDVIEKSDTGDAVLRVMYNFNERRDRNISLDGEEFEKLTLPQDQYNSSVVTVPPSTYTISIDGKDLGKEKLSLGGVYTLLIQENDAGEFNHSLLTITEPNSMHMLWLIPQYVILTLGEVMFSISGLEFSFTQAPVSMKSVLQSGWLLTDAFGNLIVVIIAEAKFFDSQEYEFYLFAGLMVVDMAIFGLMSMSYQYVGDLYDNKKKKDIPLADKSREELGIENSDFNKDD